MRAEGREGGRRERGEAMVAPVIGQLIVYH